MFLDGSFSLYTLVQQQTNKEDLIVYSRSNDRPTPTAHHPHQITHHIHDLAALFLSLQPVCGPDQFVYITMHFLIPDKIGNVMDKSDNRLFGAQTVQYSHNHFSKKHSQNPNFIFWRL
jgi:hypothetical protein